MNKYLVQTFSDGPFCFECLFKVEDKPFDYNYEQEVEEYRILEVLVGHKNLQIKKSKYYYVWRFLSEARGITDSPAFNNAIYDEYGDDPILEFPDNESALLWFKLEYGG